MSKMAGQVYVTANAKMVIPTDWHAQSMHSHRPIELVASLDGPIELRCGDGQVICSDCFLVPPMRRHALARYDGRVARVYLDAGYRSVGAWKRKPILTEFADKGDLMSRLAGLFVAGEAHDAAHEILRSWIASWVTSAEIDEPSDLRVAKVLQHLDSQGASPAADREGMAGLVGLSPSRFGAIFAKDTGASLSRYLIWRRVKIALSLICGGESVTSAAVAAGFADGAHLTRSCRTTYGCSPSSVVDLVVSHEDGVQPSKADPHTCFASHPILRARLKVGLPDTATSSRPATRDRASKTEAEAG